ncbi:potassium transporter 5-like [Vicia villosa]|uniref:potassium transporter 5-like n=1 Tax=Vicia villosa TaxID=3911 RepID=UPI00273B5530|nr:potassium transporter 5-like [Vicia villosa]
MGVEEDAVVVNMDTVEKTQSRKYKRNDSLELEARTPAHARDPKGESTALMLQLAFQSLGIVYGDIGTSPLYVFSSVFPEGIKDNDDILGVFSLIFYTLTLIPFLKYVFFVLRATDNGDGGTFALYSLVCRYAKVGLLPNKQIEDTEVSNYQLKLPNRREMRASKLKIMLESSHFMKIFLLSATLLGTSMVIGDGVLTPCISVLSAVGGIKEAASSITENQIVLISVIILIGLFMVQRFGTDKVGYSFAPIICIWFALIACIGLYNFIKHDPLVIKALNPKYIVDYFARNKTDAWISLGGIVLCTTGAEALFADVGHFSVRSIQISMCCVTYPSLILAYAGQAAFLRKNNDLVSATFYKSIPASMYWPMFVVAVLAAIIASQAMISGTFSIIQQSLSLGCFPRVQIVHTSEKYEGQVYIPEVNYILMIACIAITVGFKNTTQIGNAYGIAVVFVMALTSAFLILIMVLIWNTHIVLVIAYALIIGSVELIYLSSVLYKFDQGGYLPLAFAFFLMFIMFVWNNVFRKKYCYEHDHKISQEKLREIACDTSLSRLPGLGMFYSELVQGIPPIFRHFVANVPALHSVLVFVCIKSLPISKVAKEERFLFRRVQPKELNVFRCVVRYGYTDARNEQEPFEKLMLDRLKEFIVNENYCSRQDSDDEAKVQEAAQKEIDIIEQAARAGVVHLMGENEVVARKGAGMWRRFLIDYSYNFLKKNLRESERIFDIPQQRMVKVGMTYEL